MRLINTYTFELREFFDSDIPPYAILSHRWEQDEVSYQDLLEGSKKGGAGYTKIRNFCAVALRHNFEWAWVDTCCIDKKSSADLSEAINAMFSWYRRSVRCYVYLSDVNMEGDEIGRDHWPTFQKSKWFTRGWTLQELIAPDRLVFYDHHWHLIGDRHNMANDIIAATGIPRHAFESWGRTGYSVAQRMSWASQRETSRVEDIAYCLLGLFDVKMPLLYGEGAFAFKRLQEEIIKVSSDETLFVWLRQNRHERFQLLADSPACFDGCGKVLTGYKFWRKPYSITNQGLKLSTALFTDPHSTNIFKLLIPLNCFVRFEDDVASWEDRKLMLSDLALEIERPHNPDVPVIFKRTGWCKMPAEAKEVESTKTIYIQDRIW